MNQTFKFVFGAMACWYGLTAQAQQGSRITGMVVDGTGEPVIGATVMQEGTSNGVVTDIDGKFVINVPAGSKPHHLLYRFQDDFHVGCRQYEGGVAR